MVPNKSTFPPKVSICSLDVETQNISPISLWSFKRVSESIHIIFQSFLIVKWTLCIYADSEYYDLKNFYGVIYPLAGHGSRAV
jgi:hypothetical protein